MGFSILRPDLRVTPMRLNTFAPLLLFVFVLLPILAAF